MKTIILHYITFIPILISTPVLAQVNINNNNSTYVTNATGQNFGNETISVDWCIGELLILPGLNTAVDISSGSIKAFPTITKDFISILVNSAEKGNIKIIITDVLGRVLIKNTLPINEWNVQRKIPVGNLSMGSYFLQVQLVNATVPRSQYIFKFIKI